MKIKKLTSVLLVVLLVVLSGCNSSSPQNTSSVFENSSSKTVASSINLLYSSKDSLDPYSCLTEQNSALSQLMYESLLVLDNNFNIEYRLAKLVTVENKLCSIVLNSAKFSDGTDVTPSDVVFSFNKAKKSSTAGYSSSLKYAVSAQVTGENSLSVTLSRNDPNFANLLTFPILKTGSDELKDEDNKSLPPIGAGKYLFNMSDATLTQNKYYYGKKSSITTIKTVDCPDNEAKDQAVKNGMVDLYYTDLTDNVIPKMNGNSAEINQNNIVFLGVNPNHSQLKNSYFRQAISAAIDRKEICYSAYHSKASPALGPFPSIWNATQSFMSIESTANKKMAESNLNLSGFTEKGSSGYYMYKNGNSLTLSLLVNSENELRVSAAQKIAENLKSVGIKINLKSVSLTEYKKLLKNGNYDLYIGEIRMENNMDLGGLVLLNSASALLNADDIKTDDNKEKSTSSYNTSSIDNASSNTDIPDINLTALQAYKGYYNSEYSLQDLITAFIAELPVIPICFKNGLVIYSDSFGEGLSPSSTDLFHGMQ